MLAVGGLAATPWLVAPAVLVLLTTVPLRAGGTVHTRACREGTDDWPAFRRLTTVVVLRSIVYVGLSGFVGLHVASQVDGGSGWRVPRCSSCSPAAPRGRCSAAGSPGGGTGFSLHITLGQDYLPSRPGTASGVTLGLAVSAGGLFAPVLGAVADATSLRLALALLMPAALAAWLLSRRLVEPGVRIP